MRKIAIEVFTYTELSERAKDHAVVKHIEQFRLREEGVESWDDLKARVAKQLEESPEDIYFSDGCLIEFKHENL